MDDPVSKEEKSQRFDRLCRLQNAISLEKHTACIGKMYRVLIDGAQDGLLTARTQGGRLVRLQGTQTLIGQFRYVRITGASTWSLTGELAEGGQDNGRADTDDAAVHAGQAAE